MPMPELDPTRFFAAVLADPSHQLPLPGRGGRLFAQDGEVIDSADSFYASLLADGSLRRKPVDAPEAGDEPSKADKSDVSGADPKPPAAMPSPVKADPKA